MQHPCNSLYFTPFCIYTDFDIISNENLFFKKSVPFQLMDLGSLMHDKIDSWLLWNDKKLCIILINLAQWEDW